MPTTMTHVAAESVALLPLRGTMPERPEDAATLRAFLAWSADHYSPPLLARAAEHRWHWLEPGYWHENTTKAAVSAAARDHRGPLSAYEPSAPHPAAFVLAAAAAAHECETNTAAKIADGTAQRRTPPPVTDWADPATAGRDTPNTGPDLWLWAAEDHTGPPDGPQDARRRDALLALALSTAAGMHDALTALLPATHTEEQTASRKDRNKWHSPQN